MAIELDEEDTESPAAHGGEYVVRSGARAGQPISAFPTDLLKVIVKNGKQNENRNEPGIFQAASDELDRRVASAEVIAATEGRRVLSAAPAAPQSPMRGAMPLPCGHPDTLLERIDGEFLSRCIGCARLDELEDAVEVVTPRHVAKVMAAVRAWERKHHAPKGI